MIEKVSGMQTPKVIPMSDSSDPITQQDVTPTLLPDAFLQSDICNVVRAIHVPRYHELPEVELYRDQVVSFIESVLRPLEPCTEGPWLSPSMINNYVKAGLVPSPNKKLYGREHVARLLVICIFKQVLSIAAVSSLFKIQRMTYLVDTAYDYVATELENALHGTFGPEGSVMHDTAHLVTRESLLVRNAVIAFAAKAYLVGYLHYIGYEGDAS